MKAQFFISYFILTMKLQKIAASIAAMSMLASAGSALAANPENVDVTATVHAALTLAIDTNALTFDVTPTVNDGQDAAQSQTLTVESNNYAGYTVTAELVADDATADALSGVGDGGVFTSAADLSGDNYLQFMVDTVNSVIEDAAATVAAAETEYAGATDVIVTGDDTVTNGDSVVIDYDFNVDFNTIPDIYGGTLTYTLSANV